jgi:hypothetical protein
MKKIWRWFAQHPWVFSLLLIVVVALPGFIRVENLSRAQDRTIDCVSKAFSQLVDRANALTIPARDRADALDALFQTFRPTLSGQQPDRAIINAAFQKYFDAADRYSTLLREHPIPPDPRFTCPG